MFEASTHKKLLVYLALLSVFFAVASLLQLVGISAGTRCPCKPKGQACDPKAVPDTMLKLECCHPLDCVTGWGAGKGGAFRGQGQPFLQETMCL